MPSTPRPRPPRQVFLIFLVVLLVLGGGGAALLWGAFALTKQARMMTAVAEGRVVRVDHFANGTHGGSYWPVFRWREGSRTFEQVSIFAERGLSVGDQVHVRFDPRDPKQVVDDGSFHPWTRPAAMVFVGLVFLAMFFLATRSCVMSVRAWKAGRAGASGPP